MSAAESETDRYTVPGLERGLRILGEFEQRDNDGLFEYVVRH